MNFNLTSTTTQNITNAPFLIENVEIYNGSNGIGNVLSSNSIWLSNLLTSPDDNMKFLNEWSLYNSVSPDGEFNLIAGTTYNVLIDLPIPFKNSLILRDLI